MNAQNTNASLYTKAVLDVLNSKDKSETGAFAIVDKFSDEVGKLYLRVDAARKIKEASVRGVLLDHFFDDPQAAKIGERYEYLVGLKAGVSSLQRQEKQQLKRKMNNAVMFLTRVVDVFVSINRIRDAGMTVEFRSGQNVGTAGTICRIKGKDDDDYAPFNVAAIMRLLDKDVANVTSYAKLQELAKVGSGRNGAPNTNAPSTAEEVSAANIGRVAEGLENAFAGLTFDKDGGIPPGGRDKLLRLWAHLDAILTDEMKDKARASFAADDAGDDDEEDAA